MTQSQERSKAIVAVSALALIGALCLAPVLAAFAPLATGEHTALTQVLREPRQWRLFSTTAAVALGAASLATVLGAPAGLLLGYMRPVPRRLLAGLLAVPVLMPPYITAVAWVDVLGRAGMLHRVLTSWDASPTLVKPSGVAATIVVISLTYFPAVAFTVLLGMRRIDGRWQEAASVFVPPARSFAGIVLPIVLPYVAMGAGIVFLLALLSFSVPLLLQTPVYTVEIYTRFTSLYEPAAAVSQALPLAVFILPLLVLWRRLARRQNRFSAPGARRPPAVCRKSAAIFGAAWCLSLACIATAVPLAVLAWRSWPLDCFIEVWQTARREVTASLLLAATTATAAVALAFFAGLSLTVAGRIAALPVGMLPFLFSGPVLGLGLIRLWNHNGIAGIVYDSAAILVIASVGRYYIFAHGCVLTALDHLHKGMEEAAAVHGAGFLRRSVGITLPVAAPALIALWGLLFVLAMAELDTAVLVSPPGWTTLPVRIFTLMHYGPSRLVAALCLTTVALILAGAALAAFAYVKTRNRLIAGN